MKKEIEVKAKVNDTAAIRAAVEKLGCQLSEPISQEDRIFLDPSLKFPHFKSGDNILRIRKEKNRILFTLKQKLSNDLDSIEKEVEISDDQEFKEALELLGYQEIVRVKKTRQKTKYNNDEICLDEVEGLGTFIEMERLGEEDDSEKVQDELFTFLETLGVKREDRVVNGYDTLIWLKNHE